MSWREDEYLMISGIQHFVFCRRQWALIHIEQQWAENRLTAEGEVIHKNAHRDDFVEKRRGLLVTRGLRVSSAGLGMTGQCDVVEFQQSEDGAILHGHRGRWQVRPVEYKRGKDKDDHSDILQLCCEAMCLESMLACRIPAGDLFYHEIRRRREILFSEELRKEVSAIAEEMHEYFRRGRTPKARPSKKCQSCSLREICLPKLGRIPSVSSYLNRMMEETLS